MGRRTNGPSDQWAVGLMGRRTIERSPFQRYALETKCSQTAQRRNIIIFSSATLHIEFRLKIF